MPSAARTSPTTPRGSTPARSSSSSTPPRRSSPAAAKAKLSGRKETQKTYERFSGWRGGHVVLPASVVRAKDPARLITEAVKGMLPGNKLARGMMRRLLVYPGAEHPHAAQKPQPAAI